MGLGYWGVLQAGKWLQVDMLGLKGMSFTLVACLFFFFYVMFLLASFFEGVEIWRTKIPARFAFV